jgi:hypothetical protein
VGALLPMSIGLQDATHRMRELPMLEQVLKPPGTVSVALVNGMLSVARDRGFPWSDWLAEAGIDPALADEPEGRVTADQYIDLFRVVSKHLGDEGLGFFSRTDAPGLLRTGHAFPAGRVDSRARRTPTLRGRSGVSVMT